MGLPWYPCRIYRPFGFAAKVCLAVAPAVLDEHGAGLDKAEGHVGIHAFPCRRDFDPIKIAGAGTIIVFAAADDLLDLPGGKVLPDAYWSDEGRAHDALVLEGQVKQNFVRG